MKIELPAVRGIPTMLDGVAEATTPIGPITTSLLLLESALSCIPLLAITSILFVFSDAKLAAELVTDSAGHVVLAKPMLPQSVIISAVEVPSTLTPSTGSVSFPLSVTLT